MVGAGLSVVLPDSSTEAGDGGSSGGTGGSTAAPPAPGPTATAPSGGFLSTGGAGLTAPVVARVSDQSEEELSCEDELLTAGLAAAGPRSSCPPLAPGATGPTSAIPGGGDPRVVPPSLDPLAGEG